MMDIFSLTAAMLLSFFLSRNGLYLLSGLALLFCGLGLYAYYYKKSGAFLDPAALFSVSWIGGMGLSAMKISRLQTDWETLTWLSFYAAWLSFALGLRLQKRLSARKRDLPLRARKKAGAGPALFGAQPKAGLTAQSKACLTAQSKAGLTAQPKANLTARPEIVRDRKEDSEERREAVRLRRIFYAILAVSAVSLLCFLFEAWRLSYVPLFTKDTPHAYSYFHISGVHYFTVSCVLVPAMFVLYAHALRGLLARVRPETAALSAPAFLKKAAALGFLPQMLFAALCLFLALLIPILCVSRFQLIFSVLLAVFTRLQLAGEKIPSLRKLLFWGLLLLLCLLPLYLVLTAARAHDVSYLNGIFEMKNAKTPIFVTQPYMYVANNFDNFNCLVRDLPDGAHTRGLKMLFPLWALSGLKFLFPALVSFPLYLTKEELTTVTLFYDAFYDFGFFGVVLFGMLLGFLSGRLFRLAGKKGADPALSLIYAQLAFYLLFSFFTTWFSNPATWFYLALSLLLYLYLRREGTAFRKGVRS